MTAPLVLTMGEPAGIGGEIAVAAYSRLRATGPVFALMHDPDYLRPFAELAGCRVRAVQHMGEALSVWPEALPVLARRLPVKPIPGHPDPLLAPAVTASIEDAVRLVQSKEASALVTNPIHKHVLMTAGFDYPGHTEFLAALAGAGTVPVMMLACAALKVVPITVHMGLRQAIAALSTDRIVTAGRITADALRRDFGVANPRLAFAGLNPHAGEAGAFGREEIEIISPALEILRQEGYAVQGPMSADTMFHAAARQRYDVALCMYHDQALIPIKTIDFEHGVNVTLGLPFIRTSPDHGTALDIAGTGAANPESLIEALKLAAAMTAARERPGG